jgi:type II secretory pathway pseudopilin PulG
MSSDFTSNPSNPVPPPTKKSNTWLILLICLGVGGFLFVFCGGILAALLLPAIQAARDAAYRTQDMNNMRQISMALLNYESTYRTFPPAYTVDEQGNKLHSWRSLILPFLEGADIHQQIDFSQPWDSPANANARNRIVPAYQSVLAQTSVDQTMFQVIVDPSSMFPGETGVQIGDLRDGLSNTVMLVAADKNKAVHWMEPSDVSISDFVTPTPNGSAYRGGTLINLADGAVMFLSEDTDQATRKALVTRDGNDVASLP